MILKNILTDSRNLLIKMSLLTAFTVSIITGCRKPDDFVGKEYIQAPADLQVNSFSATADNIDFTSDSAYFIGELSERVSWYITFKGLTSGAVKRIEGLSQSISPDLAQWGGDHDPSNVKFFQQGEDVLVELSFLKSSLVIRDTITITNTKVFKGDVLYDGFELSSFAWPYLSFNENSANPYTGGFNTLNVVQGKKAFSLSGFDGDNSYFIGGARTQFTDGNSNYFEFQSLNPDSVYFNAYIYGDGNNTTRVSIGVAEDDDLDGTYEDASNDVWEYAFKIDWTGWKLVSFKYADFVTSAEAAYGGSGDKKQQLDRIKRITFNLLSDPPGNNASYLVDFPIVTYGGPFNPAD